MQSVQSIATKTDNVHVLLVDLNNFSTFPTLAIGILVSSLRNAGFSVQVLCPLAYDVPAAERERKEEWRDKVMRRIHMSTRASFRLTRNALRAVRYAWINRAHPRVLRETKRALDKKPSVLLLSAYLQHHATVVRIAAMAKERGIPLILGGPVFNMKDTADTWRRIEGVTAVVGAEVDMTLPDIVRTAISGGDLLQFDGVYLPDGRHSKTAPPLRPLENIPLPDFSDFPWDRYRLRVIPLMTGRGCQWDKCRFCSDVVSVSGRTYRTRPIESVLHEMREQSLRHQTSNFLFLDLKFNSNPNMLRGITNDVQRYVPGAQWIGTVHVDQRKDNGLSARELKAAVSAGMRRVSFGLESGSQRLLDAMHKGCTVEGNSEFIRNAHEAGLSTRCTMFVGYPGETEEDMELTTAFLKDHAPYIDRVRLNAFSIIEDTETYTDIVARPELYPTIKVIKQDHIHARALYRNSAGTGARYRRAKLQLCEVVYAINSRPVRNAATAFDGLM